MNVLAEFGQSAIKFSKVRSQKVKGDISLGLRCLLDSVALKAANECEAETGHCELCGTNILIYRQQQLSILRACFYPEF